MSKDLGNLSTQLIDTFEDSIGAHGCSNFFLLKLEEKILVVSQCNTFCLSCAMAVSQAHLG